MIRPEIGKRYRTRDGREVIIERRPRFHFHGRVGEKRGFGTSTLYWDPDGRNIGDYALDLIERIGETDEASNDPR